MSVEQWIRQSADSEEAASLTTHLVAFRSYPGEEGAVQHAVHAWLRDSGLLAEFQETEGDRPNVIARVENGAGPVLLLNGHTDTVLAAEGWSSNPWKATRAGNTLYGLGAADMKSGVAAIMLATRALAQRRDLWRGTLVFTSVVDEEAYSIGARALARANLRADACLVSEPGWEHPMLGSMGKVLVRADVQGKAAHASFPHEGTNAATEAAKFAAQLDSVPLGKHPRLPSSQTVLSFHSGSPQYVVTLPEMARVTINRHIVPGETGESVLAQMRTLADGLHSPARFTFALDPPYYPPWEMSPEHPFVRKFIAAYEQETGRSPEFGYSGFGDANLFSGEMGIPTVQCGPRGDKFHQADECVDVDSIAAAVRVYLRLALSFLQ